MPIYEYRCSSCGFQKEYLQKVSDPLLSVCPECTRETFGKMLTAAGFQLKGGGWYATDFKNSGAAPAAKNAAQSASADKSENAAATAGESTSEGKAGKTESQPAAAPAASASTAKAE